mgnify:CR=1 FL=1
MRLLNRRQHPARVVRTDEGPEFGRLDRLVAALADDAVARLAQNLDDDISSKQVLKNSAKHLGAVTQADDQLLTLIDQLNAIYLAIDRGLDFNSLLQAAIAIGQGHEHVVSPLRQYRDQILGDLIRELTDPKK